MNHFILMKLKLAEKKMNKIDPRKPRLLREAERYHRYKGKISRLKSKFNPIKKQRKLIHLLLLIFLYIIYFVLFTFFRSDENIWFNLFQNLILSIIAADIFYIFVQVMPEDRKRKSAYSIIVSQMKDDIDSYFNCVYSIIRSEVDTRNLTSENILSNAEFIKRALETSVLWDTPYRTCNWRTFGDGLAYDYYGENMINLETSLTLSNTDIFCLSVTHLKEEINNILLKYGTLLDIDYVLILENTLDCDLMFYLKSFSNLSVSKRAHFVTQSINYLLRIYEANEKFINKENYSQIANILCKLPI